MSDRDTIIDLANENTALRSMVDSGAFDLRPEVLAFARIMSAKIEGHNHDRGEYGWRSANASLLLQWLDGYVETLRAEVMESRPDVGGKAANVANLAMMIADVARRFTTGDDK